jgi:zinc and cadmium transporter
MEVEYPRFVSTPIIIQIIAAFAVAMIGGLLSALIARTHERLCGLISLGAGTLLGVAVFGIAPECLEAVRWWQFILAATTGYLLFALISKYVFHICPACAASHCDEAMAHRFNEIAVPMMFALAIHCSADGLALTAGSEEAGALGFSIALAICVHKLPEGLALGSLLLGAGLARGRMLWLAAAVQSMTVLGGIVGWLVLRHVSEFWVALVLAHAGGGFFYLATHAVVGEILKHHKKLVVISFSAGLIIIGFLILAFHLKT